MNRIFYISFAMIFMVCSGCFMMPESKPGSGTLIRNINAAMLDLKPDTKLKSIFLVSGLEQKDAKKRELFREVIDSYFPKESPPGIFFCELSQFEESCRKTLWKTYLFSPRIYWLKYIGDNEVNARIQHTAGIMGNDYGKLELPEKIQASDLRPLKVRWNFEIRLKRHILEDELKGEKIIGKNLCSDTGSEGNGIWLNGKDACLEIPRKLCSRGAMTISLMAKPASGCNGYLIESRWNFSISVRGGKGKMAVGKKSAEFKLPENRWSEVVIIKNFDREILALYVDRKLAAKFKIVSRDWDYGPIDIGKSAGSPSGFFTGSVDRIEIRGSKIFSEFFANSR